MVGESSLEDIAELDRRGVNQLTFTAYREHIKRVCIKIPLTSKRYCFNIRNPFSTSQIPTLNKLKELYPKKFNYFFVNLLSNRGKYKELIEWGIDNNKDLLLTYSNPDQSDESVTETMYEFCEKLNNTIN